MPQHCWFHTLENIKKFQTLLQEQKVKSFKETLRKIKEAERKQLQEWFSQEIQFFGWFERLEKIVNDFWCKNSLFNKKIAKKKQGLGEIRILDSEESGKTSLMPTRCEANQFTQTRTIMYSERSATVSWVWLFSVCLYTDETCWVVQL